MTALNSRPSVGTGNRLRTGTQRRDLIVWLALVAFGLVATAIAVAADANLGTAAAPFLGYYRVAVEPTAVVAPLVAIVVMWTATRRAALRWHWPKLLGLSYLAGFAWLVGLALMQGTDGLTAYLTNRDGYRPQVGGIHSIAELFAAFADPHSPHSTAVNGHPPGTVLVLWALRSAPIPTVWAGVIWSAIAAATVPLVLSVARSACGPVAARGFAPLLILAPYAIWMAVGPDGITVTVAAAALAAADYASHRSRRGWPATGWAIAAGLLLAAATMFSYIVAWLGLSMVCLNFARRRPWHNLATGLGALLPLAAVEALGFNWAEGLTVAYEGYLARIELNRSVWWWMGLCFVVAILACGPAIVSSARKLRNTPAWPFMVGGAAAAVFSAGMGIARGGVEETWLPFFPWLIIAATAPAAPGGRPLPAPLLVAGSGAIATLGMQLVLVSPW